MPVRINPARLNNPFKKTKVAVVNRNLVGEISVLPSNHIIGIELIPVPVLNMPPRNPVIAISRGEAGNFNFQPRNRIRQYSSVRNPTMPLNKVSPILVNKNDPIGIPMMLHKASLIAS